MKTLVIHPKDETTLFLSKIYIRKKWEIINYDVEKNELIKIISNYDQIFMMGHGTPRGLLGFNKYIIDEDFVPVSQNKKCVFIWCHANVFCIENRLIGLNTGMIISEPDEARLYRLSDDIDSIEESNKLFALTLSKYIDKPNFHKNILEEYLLPGNVIVEFNRVNIFGV